MEHLVPWHEIKEYLVGWLGSEKQRSLIQDVVNEVEEKENYQDDTLLGGEAFFDILDIIVDKAKGGDPDLEPLEKFISVLNSQLFYNFRDKVATGHFSGDGWPETDISGGTVKGRALMKPENISPLLKDEALQEMQKNMREQVFELAKHGDLAVDILDIVISKHIKSAENPWKPIKITADDFLQARGIKKMLGGSGRRGGYKDNWRQEISKYIYILSDAFIEVAEMETYETDKHGKRKRTQKKNLHSRAIILSSLETQDRIDEAPDITAWWIRPGDCFIPFLTGPGYQAALLSQKALAYDYNKFKIEKRLARYFAWIWRMENPREDLKVSTLLNAASMDIIEDRPNRTRSRLESALNRLQKDGVISSWRYDRLSKQAKSRQGWLRYWLESKIIIIAPKEILQHYEELKAKRKQLKSGGKPNGNRSDKKTD